MDNFDDLLAPSRAALEQNPFADPFGKRSESPDPWSSYAHGSSSHMPDEASAFADVRSATPTAVSSGFGGVPVAGFDGFEESTSPSESHRAEELEEDVPEPSTPTDSRIKTTTPRSPGFRESIPTSIEETIASPVSERKPSPPPIVSPPVSTAPSSATPSPPLSPVEPPTQASVFNDTARRAPSSFTSSLPPPTITAQQPFFSPLDQPQSIGHSFASLALGGETHNEWQGSQSVFVTPTKPQSSLDDDEDDDDDKPILQARMSLSDRGQGASVPSSPPANKPTPNSRNGIAPVFSITVDDPQRVGDPIRGYTMYTVHTKTTSPLYSKSAFSVLRRYSDFLWLYETLSNNNPGVVVPPVPEKSPFNRFDASFVQQRRQSLEKCIHKIANHPVLQKDPDLKLFLESDTFALDIKHRKAEIAHEKGGLMATIGQTISGPRFYETDEWFDKQKSYLDSLELQLRGLVKAIDSISKQRAELALAAGEFAQTIVDLSTSDVGLGTQLASSLAGLAAVERKAQELQDKQSNEDTMTMMSTADEYARLISSVRLAFSSRVRMYHAWQNADANVKRVKQTHESNRAQGRIPADQLSRSLALVADAERRALDSKQEFDTTSRLVKAEVARFEQERVVDFKNALETYLDGMISKQKELISSWEAYQQTLLKKVQPVGQRQRAESSAAAS
ncbi:Vps5 C terminal like-domain-containing protein [Cytidiella melzeri]|nr:Vps5 C terminal like-domain-containing protein [Cytidiella melzeri]